MFHTGYMLKDFVIKFQISILSSSFYDFCSILKDEGVYNTYVIDHFDDWALIMHCAEKKKSSRYLSALALSREPTLGNNVKVFLREKLPQYNIDLDYMFDVRHDDCKQGIGKYGSTIHLFF